VTKSHWIVALCFVMSIAGTASASGKTPPKCAPRVTACDNERGTAFLLCAAYCEALDCDNPKLRRTSSKNNGCEVNVCEQLKAAFVKKTGRALPCDTTCPCSRNLELFADINSGAVVVQQCIMTDTSIFVTTNAGTAVIDGNTPSCSVDGGPPFVTLSDAELLACRLQLQAAAAAQGVVCVFPE
jgi:hypothetical protein